MKHVVRHNDWTTTMRTPEHTHLRTHLMACTALNANRNPNSLINPTHKHFHMPVCIYINKHRTIYIYVCVVITCKTRTYDIWIHIDIYIQNQTHNNALLISFYLWPRPTTNTWRTPHTTQYQSSYQHYTPHMKSTRYSRRDPKSWYTYVCGSYPTLCIWCAYSYHMKASNLL